MRYNILMAVLLLIAITTSCNKKPTSLTPDDYSKWMATEKSGLNKQKKIKNVNIKARLVPAAYLAYKEYISDDSIQYDSVLNRYKCGLTFQINLQAEKNDKIYGNLMYYNISSQEEFMARSRYMNFNMQNFLSLEHKAIIYEPVLSQFEGYDQLGNKLNFQVVFIVPAYNCGMPTKDFDTIKLTFDDPCWDLGTINFEFDKDDVGTIPSLIL